MQIVLLGTGELKYHKRFDALADKHAGALGVKLAFDNRLAHLIEAGSDMFLMPSLYEPCGLNQMYSLRYGTIPVVRKTGGLADTVQNHSQRTGKGNGFVFTKPRPSELYKAVARAVELYREAPDTWRALMRHGMQLDFSWDASAHSYAQLYRRLRRGD
jgi:starch synthase